MVVPAQPRANVIGDSNIVPRRIDEAPDDVDDVLFHSMHAAAKSTGHASSNTGGSVHSAPSVRSFFKLKAASEAAETAMGPPPPASAGFGETAFA